jgi:hypothetical protein
MNAADESRIKRVERYLAANAAALAAETENGGLPLPGDYDLAVALLAAEEATPGTYTAEEIAAAQMMVDAYDAEATAIAAFEEADNQPYDPDRRAVYDALAEYMALNTL